MTDPVERDLKNINTISFETVYDESVEESTDLREIEEVIDEGLED